MRPGLVSVMMPAFNAAQYVHEAISSLFSQTYRDWELVVVNDGSTDDTASIVSSFDDPRVTLINQENRGEAAARNTALKHIRGEYLAFLDSDDIYLPNHLEAGVNYLRAHPLHQGVYSDGYHIDSEGKRLQTLSSRRRGPFIADIFEEVVYASDVFGPPLCVILRTQPIREHGLVFDTSIVIGPDWDFFVKFSSIAQFGYSDMTTCLYRIHATNISVQTSLGRRSRELAKCRINATKLARFEQCSKGTKYWVFFDLLINLTRDQPNLQEEIADSLAFKTLPKDDRARIFRLMASKAILLEKDPEYIHYWFERSIELERYQFRVALLWNLFRLNAALCRFLLRLRTRKNADRAAQDPFSDIIFS